MALRTPTVAVPTVASVLKTLVVCQPWRKRARHYGKDFKGAWAVALGKRGADGNDIRYIVRQIIGRLPNAALRTAVPKAKLAALFKELRKTALCSIRGELRQPAARELLCHISCTGGSFLRKWATWPTIRRMLIAAKLLPSSVK